MTSHSRVPSHEMIEESVATERSNSQSSTIGRNHVAGRIRYWWSLFVAGVLLLIFGPPALFLAWVKRKRESVYPWAEFGARRWLRLSGARVHVTGAELLDPTQTYV